MPAHRVRVLGTLNQVASSQNSLTAVRAGLQHLVLRSWLRDKLPSARVRIES